jgi:hypothetical protein
LSSANIPELSGNGAVIVLLKLEVYGHKVMFHSFIVEFAVLQVQSFVDVNANPDAVNPVFKRSVPVLVSAEKLYFLIVLLVKYNISQVAKQIGDDGVTVVDGVTVDVTVDVIVTVGVNVLVGVTVGVIEEVGVLVGVGVRVLVGVGVGNTGVIVVHKMSKL